MEGAQAFEKSPAGCHKQCRSRRHSRSQSYLDGKLFDCFKCRVSHTWQYLVWSGKTPKSNRVLFQHNKKYFTILHISAEAYLREKQRNDHLNNLGLKRRTSLRKSISKKLKRHKKQTNLNDQTSATTTASEAIEVVDNGGTNNSKKQQKSHCDVHEEPFRRPSYSGQSGSQSNIPSKV